MTILEGESLLNDATALVALRTAIVAAAATVTRRRRRLDFVVAAVGGVARRGAGLPVVVGYVRKHVTDPVIDTALSLVTPFVAYVAAEEIHASGVLAVVIAGLLLGHKAPILQTASSRIAERLNWRTHLVPAREHRVPADRPAGALDPRGRRGQRAVHRHEVVLGLRGHAPGRRSCCGSPGSSRRATCWSGPARTRRPAARRPWTLHPGARLGRDARRGHAGGGVRDPARRRAPRGAGAHRPRRRGRHAVPAGLDPAVAGTPAASCPHPTRARTRWPGRSCCEQATAAGLEVLETSTSSDDDPFDTLRCSARPGASSATSRPGSGSGPTRRSETPSEPYARLRLEMLRRRARQGAGRCASTGTVPHEVVEDVLATLDVEESMLGYGPQRSVELARGRGESERLALSRVVRAPDERAAVTSETRGPERRVRGLRPRGHHLGAPAAVPGVRPRSPAATPRPRGTPPRTSTTTGHPVVRSAEPGEEWRWCFVDDRLG